MRGLGSLLAIIMNFTMMEKRLQKDIDDIDTANTKFNVVLRSEEGPVEVEVHPGELIFGLVIFIHFLGGIWRGLLPCLIKSDAFWACHGYIL